MIKLSQSEQRTPEYLSQGSLCRFNRCEANYALYAILGRKSKGIFSPLEYGKAIHCAMPFLQRRDPSGALKAFTDVWSKSGAPDDDKRSVNSAASMLAEWYSGRMVSGSTPPYTIIEPPQTAVAPTERRSEDEFSFLVDLGSELPFYGLLDGLGVKSESHWVIEYKTTSELATRFLNAFHLNVQIIGYVTAVSILMPQAKVVGTFVEALRVSKNPYSQCIPVFVEEHEINSFISHYNKTVKRILECLEKGEWEQNFCSCTTYNQYGQPGYTCPYLDLCKTADWRSMLDSYKVDTKTPFTELKSKETKG